MEEKKFNFNKTNRAVIVKLKLPDESGDEHINSIEEIELLAKTLGFSIDKIFVQNKQRIESDFFIGKGKVYEIQEYIAANKIDAVLFDNDLTGVQERNLEKIINIPIFGRTEIILNIFSKRARTTEAKLQVELAGLEYMFPRLRNRWTHFSRVEGGIGLRGGEGEKQLELDRRMIKNQISKLKDRLVKIDMQMSNRRRNRDDTNLVSLVGYTNAGKTSLINLLAKTNLFAENMLFSTLDSTIRKVYINDDLSILLNDTVGFINKLPHNLVASFKSTLDEIKNSKLILHVIDASSSNILSNIYSVNKVLEEIDAINIPTIRVFNKADLIKDREFTIDAENGDLFISVKEKTGITELKEKIHNFFIKT